MNGYLLDTNILIYYFADLIPKKEDKKLENIFRSSFNISIITKIELLGWQQHTEEGFIKAKEFIAYANIYALTQEVADITINIRRKSKIRLPDAVIAGTALNNNLTLVTRNEKDFIHVKNLKIYNPY